MGYNPVLQQLVDLQPERCDIDWLADVGIETGPQTFFAIFLHHVRGEGHDPKVGETRVLADPRQDAWFSKRDCR